MNLKSINTPKNRYLAVSIVDLVGLILLFTIPTFWVWGVVYYSMRVIAWGVNRALATKYGRHARAAAIASTTTAPTDAAPIPR